MWPGRPRDPRTGDLARRGSAEAGREAIRRRLAGVLVALLALSGHTRSAAESSEFEAAVAEVVLERNGTLVARGSGVVIAARAEDGAPACYLLTAGHVVKAADAATAIVVALPGEGGRRSVPGELVRRVDRDDRDLALLRAVAPDCRPVPVAPASEWGSEVWLAGFPSRGAARVWPGHLPPPRAAGESRWTIDAGVTEGASGGGVFDARTGRLVGLIQGYWTARLVGPDGAIGGEVATGRTAVIPLARVRALLGEWGLERLLDE